MKKKIIIYSAVYFVLIGLFILGTFFDLSISHVIADVNKGEYYSKNIFANFIEGFGEIPVYLLLAGSVCICGYTLKDRWEKLKLIVLFVTHLGVFIIFTICFYRCVSTLGNLYGFAESLQDNFGFYICSILCGLAFAALSVWLCSLIGEEKMSKFYYFALTVIIVLSVIFFATHIIKGIVNRPRYRTLNIIGFKYYTPWYKICHLEPDSYIGIVAEEGFVSFPSGHVSWNCTTIMLCFLPRFVKLDKKSTLLFTIIPPSVCVIVAISRMVAGGHFLTDVIFSFIMSFILEEITVFIILLIKKKREEKLNKQLLVE